MEDFFVSPFLEKPRKGPVQCKEVSSPVLHLKFLLSLWPEPTARPDLHIGFLQLFLGDEFVF
jgi:hypothetical protein